MEQKDFRYSAQVQVKGEWQSLSAGNDLGYEKNYVRRQVDKHPGFSARIVDTTTGETVFIDPDPNALKIRFCENEGDGWRNLELTYVDEEGKWLYTRDGSDMGVWVSIDQTHPDDREVALEFGRKLERREYTSEEIKALREAFHFIRQRAAYLRSRKAQEKEADAKDD